MTGAEVACARVGRRLRVIRELLGINQEQVAVVSSRSYVSRVETGVMTPSLGWLEKVSELLGISPRVFLGSDEEFLDESLKLLKRDPFVGELAELLPKLSPAARAAVRERLLQYCDEISGYRAA